MWCVGEWDEEYIARMEEVLGLYEKPLCEPAPVVCIDEKPVVLHGEIRSPIAMKPGRAARRDYEYKRCGTANVFCGIEPKAGRHFTKVTPTRCSAEFADYLLDIAASYPEADTIHLVMDNLSTHTRKALVERFGEEAGLVVEAFYGALHSQAWKLAEPGGDRGWFAFPAMLRKTPNRRHRFLAPPNSGLDSSHEPRPGHHPMEVYTQARPTQVSNNHAVEALVDSV